MEGSLREFDELHNVLYEKRRLKIENSHICGELKNK